MLKEVTLQDFEIVKTSMGVTSIRNNRVNEIMHNPVGPLSEANALYVEQPKLRNHLRQPASRDLIVFDIGLGAGSNAIAAMSAAIKLQGPRRLHLISFENDLSLLEFALRHSAAFEHMQGFETAIESILSRHQWQSPCGKVGWELRAGDFLACIETELSTADIIFYDPYSPKVNQEMWTLACFRKLRAHCHDAHSGEFSTNFYTYSCSTPIRSALLLAGFYVGCGEGTGLKVETTQASTHLGQIEKPLDNRWLQRWQRSHVPLPHDATIENRPQIEDHVQFKTVNNEGLLHLKK